MQISVINHMILHCFHLLSPTRTPRVLRVQLAQETLAIDWVVHLGFTRNDFFEALNPTLYPSSTSCIILWKASSEANQGKENREKIILKFIVFYRRLWCFQSDFVADSPCTLR
eukprot:TRINITY_DN34036_c0_g1_i1.p1 TRINITY_DN34036_c0_g1~~TRINITY_DN34036_c0_g1_i1.p1  ORF type:complete len:113 (-),score=14.51 TRINITY_DN34036_c0_g1_i1:6-344(-)